jgi:YidC/Oxa1 family membrane protein insertase
VDGLNVNGAVLDYEMLPAGDVNISGDATAQVAFRFTDGAGRFLEKVFTFKGNSYGFELGLQVGGLKERLRNAAYTLGWESPLQITELDTLQDATYSEAVVLLGDEVQNFYLGLKKDSRSESFKGNLGWITVRSKYFGAAVIPVSRTAAAVEIFGQKLNGEGTSRCWATPGRWRCPC